MKNIFLFSFFIFFKASYVFSQSDGNLFIRIPDTISKEKNSIRFHNNSNDSIYVHTAVYDSDNKLLIKNILFTAFKKAPAKTTLVKRILPMSVVDYELKSYIFSVCEPNRFYFFKTLFQKRNDGKLEEVKEETVKVFIKKNSDLVYFMSKSLKFKKLCAAGENK